MTESNVDYVTKVQLSQIKTAGHSVSEEKPKIQDSRGRFLFRNPKKEIGSVDAPLSVEGL